MFYDHDSLWEVIKVYIVTGAVSMFGALAHVMYQVTHGRVFSFGFLLFTLFFVRVLPVLLTLVLVRVVLVLVVLAAH